jgi:hypothetical protein
MKATNFRNSMGFSWPRPQGRVWQARNGGGEGEER